MRNDEHRSDSLIADVILGGQDGLVNVLGVILGVTAAGGEARLVLAAGLAATFAESVSMAAVAYTSRTAQGELYESERLREYRHLDARPELEKEEVREIYAKKGFKGAFLDRTVETITANRDVWVAVMMSEEHALQPVDKRQALRAAFVVGVSSLIGSLVPIVPYMIATTAWNTPLALVLSALVLFAMGAYKARVTAGRWARRGIELAAIGMASAFAGYAIGLLFRVQGATG